MLLSKRLFILTIRCVRAKIDEKRTYWKYLKQVQARKAVGQRIQIFFLLSLTLGFPFRLEPSLRTSHLLSQRCKKKKCNQQVIYCINSNRLCIVCKYKLLDSPKHVLALYSLKSRKSKTVVLFSQGWSVDCDRFAWPVGHQRPVKASYWEQWKSGGTYN